MAKPRKYTVLMDDSAGSVTGPFGLGGRRGPTPGILGAAAPEPKVESAELTPAELLDETRNPRFRDAALDMPTALIKPFDVDGGAAAGSAWGVQAVGADVSHFTGQGVTVAVLDTGIAANHPAFAGVTLVQEDFSGDGNGDVNGHGSHCAGTIFGRDVNGTRIGVARGVQKALIGKVLRDNGSGSSDMMFQAINWATSGGAKVLSMSLGFDFPGFVRLLVEEDGLPIEAATSIALDGYRSNLRMFDALMNMIESQIPFTGGALVVAASGNESGRPDFEVGASIPAAARDVISVGALGQAAGGLLNVAAFSNTFPQISAPGVGVLSVNNAGGLRALSGTSMACPHVAGVAALWWEQMMSSPVPASPKTVLARMIASARQNVFAVGVDMADRGVGLATAP